MPTYKDDWHDSVPTDYTPLPRETRGDRLDERNSMEMLVIAIVIVLVILCAALAHLLAGVFA
jgi:hypothetical protein